jgi:hypothetical protein
MAGFGRAPKQTLFYAVWSPASEDLLVELVGDIDDGGLRPEETSLEERVAQRVERFTTYQGKHTVDAEQARKAVASVADGIPLGQPILVVLVALCTNGPRQQAELRPLATTWDPPPDGTFADQGTGARVVLMTVRG